MLHVRMALAAAPLLAVSLAGLPAAAEGAFEINGAYTGELWNSASGGVQRGTRYINLLEVGLGFNGSANGLMPGANANISVVYFGGGSPSALTGAAQAVSSIETGYHAVRLLSAWGEQNFFNGLTSLKLGQWDFNEDFDSGETRGLFVQSSHGAGIDIAQTGNNGPGTFPNNGLAARLRQSLGAGYVQAMVSDGVPHDPNRPERFASFGVGGQDGALVMAEAGWTFGEGGRVLAGAWTYTKGFDYLEDPNTGTFTQRARNRGAYVFAESPLLSGLDGAQLSGFVRAGIANGRINGVGAQYSAGLVLSGFLADRADDQLGLAVSVAEQSRAFRDATRVLGLATDALEANVELTYKAEVLEGVSLQPTLQWIANPGFDPDLADAFAVGFRVSIERTVFSR
jgi:porin